MPGVDDSAEYPGAERGGSDSLRSGKALHPGGDDSMGSTAGSRIRGKRAVQGDAAIGRKRLYRARWGRDAHSAQWVNRVLPPRPPDSEKTKMRFFVSRR